MYPYLFILCIEKLSHLINEAIILKRWNPFNWMRNGSIISHLIFFIDDIILLYEATSKQTTMVKECHDTFCLTSGKEVSFDKPNTFDIDSMCVFYH